LVGSTGLRGFEQLTFFRMHRTHDHMTWILSDYCFSDFLQFAETAAASSCGVRINVAIHHSLSLRPSAALQLLAIVKPINAVTDYTTSISKQATYFGLHTEKMPFALQLYLYVFQNKCFYAGAGIYDLGIMVLKNRTIPRGVHGANEPKIKYREFNALRKI
jgi:hypothetical protein